MNGMSRPYNDHPAALRLLRLLPPPARLARPLGWVPQPMVRRGLARILAQVLTRPLADGSLSALRGRRLGVEVTDLGLRWGVRIGERELTVCDADAGVDATVRGTLTDLLLLASRLEDADTLFFHRRLQLTGDVELGLTLRNLLDQLPWDSVPPGLRVALAGGARLARAARSAYHAGTRSQ